MNRVTKNQYCYRKDIDGLRAISILLVLFYHAFPDFIPGGYIGVDIFFVISGFVITRVIFQDISLGRFSLTSFYAKRIKRIFPALIIVLFSVVLSGWFLLTSDELKNLSIHLMAGGLFASNFLLLNEAGYFDSSAELKPLLHLWSLGIEEQFYIFWPLLIILSRNFKFQHRLAVTLFLFFLSFYLNIFFANHDLSHSFYLPFPRFWQLLTGAMLAIYLSEIRSYIKSYEKYTVLLGFLLIVLAIILLSKTSQYPGWWALLPTLGAVLIILGNDNSILSVLLTNKFSVGVGLISYPLYLWHWPILSYLHIVGGHIPSALWRIVALLLSFGLAIATYFMVEKKIRHNSAKFLTGILIFLMSFLLVVGYVINKKDGFESRYKNMILLNESFKNDFIRWEDTGLVPNVDCTNSFEFPKWKICLQSNVAIQPTAALIGDSHAFHAYWGISELFKRHGNLILLGRGACMPFLNLSNQITNAVCDEAMKKVYEYVLNESNIQKVFIAHRFFYINHLSTIDQLDSFERSVDETFNVLTKAGKQIVYLKSVPEPAVNPKLCIGELPWGRTVAKEHCKFFNRLDLDRQEKYISATNKILAKHKNVTVFDPRKYLCEIERCSLVIDGKVMFMDENHLSLSGSRLLGSKLKKYIQ